MKKFFAFLMVALMVLSLVGCAQQDAVEEAPVEEAPVEEAVTEPLKVAYLCPSLDVTFWRYCRYGVENQLKTVLGDANVEVVTYDSKNDANTQLNNAQDAITKQFDYIVISPTDSAACVSVLDVAEEAGIPVVICDIGSDSGTWAGMVGTDNYGGSYEVGEYVASLVEGDINYTQITLPMARINGQKRKSGFDDAMAAAGNNTLVDFKQMENVDRSDGYNYGSDLLTAYPDAQVVFVHSDDPALGALAAAEEVNSNVIISCFDINMEVVEAVKAGKIAAVGAQQPVLMGRTCSDMVISLENGEEFEAEVYLPTLLVTSENIGDVYDTLIATAMTEE